jgi:hypothetical protein
MLGPAGHAGLEKGAIDDQLATALNQVEEIGLALGPDEFVLLLSTASHGIRRRSAASLSRDRVSSFP